ncbi:MAG: hypothetical protein MJY56_06685 [Bacteroidales bacterium]|nr:hypothetical protein [Bacteroidales bacterium]
MEIKTRNTIIGVALVLLGCALFALYQCEKRAKVADIVSDEAEMDLKDSAVKPLPVSIDVNNLEDGIYPVAFSQDEIVKADGGYNVPFEVFNMDLYDTVELHQMEVGGYIEIAGELIKIETLSKDGTILINGGLDNGGADLISIGGGVYRYQGWDDIATYTSFGTVNLFVSDRIDFVDKGNVEESMEGVVVSGDKAFDYLSTVRFGAFNQYSTRIRVENGAVVEFYRVYQP